MKTKKIFLLVAFFLLMGITSFAQKKNDKQTVVYDVSMTCENCKKRIEKNIAFEKGVKDLKVDLPSKTVTIDYQINKTDTTNLRKAIEKLGYEVAVHHPSAEKE